MKKFYAIDASGLIFKSYFALQYLGTEDNPVNVIFGFFRIFLKLLHQQPEYVLLARDLPEETERKKFDNEYKANRPPAPEDLKIQIQKLQEIVKELGIPNIGVPGYEADDVLYTTAKTFAPTNPDLFFFIVTSDKDLKQMLDKNIYILDTTKGNSYGLQDFLNEYGFPPENFVDYLSLIGDNIDNIPGVKGIGPKTALKLIQEFGTIEKIYENLDKIEPKIREKLEGQLEHLQHNKQLIKLLFIQQLTQLNLQDFKRKPDFKKFKEILVNQMNFHSFESILNKLEKLYKTPKQVSLF